MLWGRRLMLEEGSALYWRSGTCNVQLATIRHNLWRAITNSLLKNIHRIFCSHLVSWWRNDYIHFHKKKTPGAVLSLLPAYRTIYAEFLLDEWGSQTSIFPFCLVCYNKIASYVKFTTSKNRVSASTIIQRSWCSYQHLRPFPGITLTDLPYYTFRST